MQPFNRDMNIVISKIADNIPLSEHDIKTLQDMHNIAAHAVYCVQFLLDCPKSFVRSMNRAVPKKVVRFFELEDE